MSETSPDAEVEQLEEPRELRDEPAEEPSAREDGEPPQHAYGELDIPDDVTVLEGMPDGTRRGVAIVASRYNGLGTLARLLEPLMGETRTDVYF